MMLVALMLQAATPPPEALDLGKRLAATGTLAALLPAVTAKEREDLVGEHPEWSETDKAALRATADAEARKATDRLNTAIGQSYAARLSVEELRTLVAFNESETARKLREATPMAVLGAVQQLGEFDYKGTVRKAFCAQTGKGCPAK